MENDAGHSRHIELVIDRSRRLLLALGAMHFGGALAMTLVNAPLAVRMVLLAVLIASGWHCLRRYWTGDAGTVRILTVRADGSVLVTTKAGTEAAAVLSASVVTPWLTVLVVRGAGGRNYSVVLLPDNVAAEPFRRLRARLRFRNSTIGGAQDVVRGDKP